MTARRFPAKPDAFNVEVLHPERTRVGIGRPENLIVIEFDGKGETHRYALPVDVVIEMVGDLVEACEVLRPDLKDTVH